MNAQDKVLEAKDIVISFGGLKALNGINLYLKRNEILGLIGPNGSGKTTFFNVVSGLYTPDSGSVIFNSETITGKTPQAIASLGVIRTFQTSRLWNELSILDNLLLGTFMQKKPGIASTLFTYKKVKEDFKRKGEEALALLSIFNPELVRTRSRRAKELALVDRRRVEITRAILTKPQILLLDEPAAGMDPAETRQLMEDISKIKQEKKELSIIIIEHDMAVISTIAERVVVFNFGKKIAEGLFSEISANKEVREAYLGKEHKHAGN